jgi:predicted nucleic acid-binding protein
MKYVIDSSSFINAWHSYLVESFPTLWEKLSEAIISGIVILSDMVYDELLRKEDGLKEFIKSVKDKRYTLTPELDEVVSKFANIPFWRAKIEEGDADLFVASTCIVEHANAVSEDKHIRQIGRAYNFPCIKFAKFISEMNWSFH